MQDINHALSVLGEKLGIANLQLNSNKQAEVAFADGLSVYVTEMEPGIAEMSFPLKDLDFATPTMMRAMLEANCLGQGTGAGRLAIDSGNGEALYCERWDVTTMDARQIEQRFLLLTQYGVFWRTEGAEMLVAESEKDQSVGEEEPVTAREEEILLRV